MSGGRAGGDGGDLRRALAAARERLGALADRLARSRAAVDRGAAAPAGASPPDAAAASSPPPSPPPFGGRDARPIDDLELTFSAVDPGIGVGSDQDKAR